jgi:16S rRNA (cytosine967-C5)-methyltransferase
VSGKIRGRRPARHRSPAASRRPTARAVALDVLDRIDEGGAYANLALGGALDRSGLAPADRRFATDLVYGTTRMRRACDVLVDRHLARPVDGRVRNALRLGAYQLSFAGVPPHAAVGETVEVAPRAARGLVNAVLRRVAESVGLEDWPDEASRLSVPERVLDLCAAPGGKATALAATGAWVVAGDARPSRAGLVRANAERTGVADRVAVVAADGTRAPWRPGAFDRVLVDAPCSGLGTLRRRADLRWRATPDAVDRLAGLQRRLVVAAADLVRPGGALVYAVCTLTAAESTGVDEAVAGERPDLVALPPPDEPWAPWGRGAILLPQAAGTDGMCLFRYRRPF